MSSEDRRQQRPVYEDFRDRENEQRVVAFLQQTEGWADVQRTPRMYPCDWVVQFTAGRSLYGLLELKVRDRKYDNYMLSLHKAANLLTYAECGNFIPMLGVCWTDTKEVGLWNPLKREYLMAGFGGRKDRGDWQDVEPVVMVPVRYSRPLRFL